MTDLCKFEQSLVYSRNEDRYSSLNCEILHAGWIARKCGDDRFPPDQFRLYLMYLIQQRIKYAEHDAYYEKRI